MLDTVREMRRGTAIMHNALTKLQKELEGTPLYDVPNLLRQVVTMTKGVYSLEVTS